MSTPGKDGNGAARPDGVTLPVEQLAKLCRMTPGALRRSLKRLAELGLVDHHYPPDHPGSVTLHVPDLAGFASRLGGRP